MTTIQQHHTQQPTNQQPIDATQQGIKTTRQQDSMTTRQQRNNPTAQQPTTQQPTNQLMRDSSTATQQPNNPTTKNPTTHQPLDAARRNARSDPPPHRGRRAGPPFFLGCSVLLLPSPKPSQNPPIILPSGFDIPPGRPDFSPSQPFLLYFCVFFGTPKLAKKSSPPKTTFCDHFADFRHVQRQFLQHFCQFWVPPGIILAGLFWVQF